MSSRGCDVSWGCSCEDWNSVGWGCNVTGVPGWVPGAVCARWGCSCDKVTGLLMWLGCDVISGVSKGSRMVLKGDDSRGCDFKVAQSVGVSWSGAMGEELGLLLM